MLMCYNRQALASDYAGSLIRGAALRSGSLLHRVEEARRPRRRGVGAQPKWADRSCRGAEGTGAGDVERL